jgi:hypothetical protein
MNLYCRNLSPEANSGSAAQPEKENEDIQAAKEEMAAKAKAAPKDTNQIINNTGLDHPPANADEDTDLSEGSHDADAASG